MTSPKTGAHPYSQGTQGLLRVSKSATYFIAHAHRVWYASRDL